MPVEEDLFSFGQFFARARAGAERGNRKPSCCTKKEKRWQWSCPACGVPNHVSRDSCRVCTEPQRAEALGKLRRAWQARESDANVETEAPVPPVSVSPALTVTVAACKGVLLPPCPHGLAPVAPVRPCAAGATLLSLLKGTATSQPSVLEPCAEENVWDVDDELTARMEARTDREVGHGEHNFDTFGVACDFRVDFSDGRCAVPGVVFVAATETEAEAEAETETEVETAAEAEAETEAEAEAAAETEAEAETASESDSESESEYDSESESVRVWSESELQETARPVGRRRVLSGRREFELQLLAKAVRKNMLPTRRLQREWVRDWCPAEEFFFADVPLEASTAAPRRRKTRRLGRRRREAAEKVRRCLRKRDSPVLEEGAQVVSRCLRSPSSTSCTSIRKCKLTRLSLAWAVE